MWRNIQVTLSIEKIGTHRLIQVQAYSLINIREYPKMLMLTVIWLTFIFSFILSRLTIMNIYCYITREKITTEGKQKITMVKVWSKLTLATFLKSSNMWQEGRLDSLALILQKACNQLTNSYSVLACSYFLTCKKFLSKK